jgi:4-hydroxy-tetrahydrodipicolinate synthase
MTTVIETVAGRVDVVVGCEHVSAYIAARRAVSAEDAGATAIMVLPSAFGEALEYYGRIADSVSCPVIIQDAGWMGVQLPDSLLRAIAERAQTLRSLLDRRAVDAARHRRLRRAEATVPASAMELW